MNTLATTLSNIQKAFLREYPDADASKLAFRLTGKPGADELRFNATGAAGAGVRQQSGRVDVTSGDVFVRSLPTVPPSPAVAPRSTDSGISVESLSPDVFVMRGTATGHGPSKPAGVEVTFDGRRTLTIPTEPGMSARRVGHRFERSLRGTGYLSFSRSAAEDVVKTYVFYNKFAPPPSQAGDGSAG